MCKHLEASGMHLEASGRHLGDIWEASGKHLGGIWRHLGSIWDASGRHLGGIWESYGTIWGHLGGMCKHLEASGMHLEASGRHLGDIWEASGKHLGCIWRHLGSIWDASGRHLGVIWESYGTIWGHLGGMWKHLEASGMHRGIWETSGKHPETSGRHLGDRMSFDRKTRRKGGGTGRRWPPVAPRCQLEEIPGTRNTTARTPTDKSVWGIIQHVFHSGGGGEEYHILFTCCLHVCLLIPYARFRYAQDYTS